MGVQAFTFKCESWTNAATLGKVDFLNWSKVIVNNFNIKPHACCLQHQDSSHSKTVRRSQAYTDTHTHMHAKANCVHSKDNTAQLKTPQFPTFTFSSTCIYSLSTVSRVQQASKLGCSIAISLETPERDRRQTSGTKAVNLSSRQY